MLNTLYRRALRFARNDLFAVVAILSTTMPSSSALAQYYVTTGHTSAQTQIDAFHTTKAYLFVTSGTLNFGGANLDMKKGSSSTDSVTVTLYQDASKGTVLESDTQPAAAFSQSFSSIIFPISQALNAKGTPYYLEVTSGAANVQSQAFFIKGTDSCFVADSGGIEATGATCDFSTPGSSIAANLTIAKSQPSPGLVAGQNSTYTLTVTNIGTADAATATVKDQLPSGLTFVSASGTNWGCSNASGLITCNFSGGTIAAGGGASTINVIVTANAGTGGQSVTNFASIDSTGGSSPPTPGASCSPSSSCASATSSIGATQTANLTITKSQPSPGLVAGQNSTYTLTVTDIGTANATTATVQDQLPSQLSFVSSSGTNWSCSNASGLITCNFSGGTIAAGGGASTINVIVTVNAGTGGQSVTNFASIDPTGGSSPPTPGASCSPSSSCAAAASSIGATGAANLTITKSQPSPGLVAGQNSTYTLTVTNIGTAGATTATVKDQLPSQLTFVSGSGTNWSCSNASGLITCGFGGGTIAAGGSSSTINVTVTANAGTGGQSVANFASIDPTGGSSPPAPGASCSPSSSCGGSTSTVSGPFLTIAKSQPSPSLDAGVQSTYTLSVTNIGNNAASTTTVKDQLPSGLTFVSASGTNWSCSNAGGLITCNFSGGTIVAGGGTSTISIAVLVGQNIGGQSVTNYASVASSGSGAAPAPGAGCTPANSCASAASTVGVTKIRTQAIVHNFLAKRGDRIAGYEIPIDRIISRLGDDEPCVPRSYPPEVFSNVRTAVPGLFADAGSQRDQSLGLSRYNSSFGPQDNNGLPFSPSYNSDASRVPSGSTNNQMRLDFSASWQNIVDILYNNQPRLGADVLSPLPDVCFRRAKPAFNFWIDGTFERLRYQNSSGNFAQGRFGIDYRLSSGALVGIMAQFDDAKESLTSDSSGYTIKGTGWMFGPYGAMRLSSGLYLDGRVLWGRSTNQVSPYNTFSDQFETRRLLASARLSGQWHWYNFYLTPSVEYIYFTDKSTSFVNSLGIAIDSQSITIQRLRFGPEFAVRLEQNSEYAIYLTASTKGIWDITPVDLNSLDGTSTTTVPSQFRLRNELGISYRNQDDLSIGVAIGVESSIHDQFSARSIAVRLNKSL